MTFKENHDGICSQAAVESAGNRYDLVLMAARRVRELNQGHRAKIASTHSPSVTALLEIEQGLVTRDYLLKDQNYTRSRK